MASYTRSRAASNSVLNLSVDQPLSVINNVGALPWDAPNRLLSWFYLPTPWQKWSVAGLVEARGGFPVSGAAGDSSILDPVDSHPLPMYLDVHLPAEPRFPLHRLPVGL